jgi:GTP-binding protein
LSLYPNIHFLLSANRLDQCPPDVGVEAAIAGRSNAGKSSAINAITQRKSLARTSKTPGQTQLLNFFELDPGRRLVDLPGYGFAKVPPAIKAHWERLVGDYMRARRSLRGLLLIVDARRGLSQDDADLIEWTLAEGRTAHVLLSKCDKLTRNEAREILRRTENELEGRASAQLFSAVTRDGVDEAREALEALLIKNPGDSGDRTTGAD